MDATLVESTANTSYGSMKNAITYHNRYAYNHPNPDPCNTQHCSNPGLSTVERQRMDDEIPMFTDSDKAENQSYQWNTGTCLQLHSIGDELEEQPAMRIQRTQRTEWPRSRVQQFDNPGHRHSMSWYEAGIDPEDEVSESMAAPRWCRANSRVASSSAASASVDSLGLHHDSISFGAADAISSTDTTPPVTSDSTGIQHELSELDITQLPPLCGTLVNWRSPPAYYSNLDEDAIASLLGQKRPRDAELDELMEKYKRRRRLGVWERA
ncbi:hypothetical protein AX15_005555 [Amanita polypyramis BW_CC]|nr:hypothetical protein AX15_005555 [Amanita polypyramis BW_CC]